MSKELNQNEHDDSNFPNSGWIGYGREAYQLVKKYWFHIKSAPTLIKLKKIKSAWRNPAMYDYLQKTYNNSLLKIGNITFPVCLFQDEVDYKDEQKFSSIISYDKDWNPNIVSKNNKFYNLMRTKIDKHDNPTFVMKSIDTSSGVKMKCGLSSFFNNLKSSHSLELEIMNEFMVNRKGNIQLPLRDKIHSYNNSPTTNGDGRASGIGISVLLVFKENNDYKLLLKKRGDMSIITRRGMFHSLPSGMFQASHKQKNIEFSILHFLLWEYLEEFFNISEPEIKNQNAKWFYDLEQVVELTGLLATNKAQLIYLGLASDLLNLRPEICLMLIISDPNWYENRTTGKNSKAIFTFNSEHLRPDQCEIKDEVIIELNIKELSNFISDTNQVNTESFVPCTVGLLKMANDYFIKYKMV